MTPAEDMLALADRVEKAEGADREINALVHKACFGIIFCRPLLPPAYTRSLDAVMTLIGPDAYWRLGNDGEGSDVSAFKATVTSHHGNGLIFQFHDAVAATPALALLAATLRARARALSTEQQS